MPEKVAARSRKAAKPLSARACGTHYRTTGRLTRFLATQRRQAAARTARCAGYAVRLPRERIERALAHPRLAFGDDEHVETIRGTVAIEQMFDQHELRSARDDLAARGDGFLERLDLAADEPLQFRVIRRHRVG